jgi:Ca2+-binding RTX toxin-like protein
MTGGGNNDRFDFSGTIGADRINGFNSGAGVADVIRITGYGAALNSFAEILAATTQVGADSVINLGGANTITLIGITKTSLVADDFQFV